MRLRVSPCSNNVLENLTSIINVMQCRDLDLIVVDILRAELQNLSVNEDYIIFLFKSGCARV